MSSVREAKVHRTCTKLGSLTCAPEVPMSIPFIVREPGGGFAVSDGAVTMLNALKGNVAVIAIAGR